jgi:hypothetical protein
MEATCEHDDEPSDFVKYWNFSSSYLIDGFLIGTQLRKEVKLGL